MSCHFGLGWMAARFCKGAPESNKAGGRRRKTPMANTTRIAMTQGPATDLARAGADATGATAAVDTASTLASEVTVTRGKANIMRRSGRGSRRVARYLE